MTDIEKYNELASKVDSLTKEMKEIKDTLNKASLAKERFRFIDYYNIKYWIKIISVEENNCDTIELCYDVLAKSYKIERNHNTFNWLLSGIPVVEELFNAKLDEFINKIKL